MALTCRICGATGEHPTYVVKEMQYGTGDPFDYFQCADCGSLQIAEIPDLSRYYSDAYYSFEQAMDPLPANPLARWLRTRRDRAAVTGQGLLGRYLDRSKPADDLHLLYDGAGLKVDSRVLDVGAGTGHLLYRLRNAGLGHTLGIDPFLPADVTHDNGLVIRRASLEETPGPWDLIMFHHAFEHVPDPVATLAMVVEKLAPAGRCLLRLPTVSCYAWERYGVNWVQIDAPRHIVVPSRDGLARLAESCGLQVVRRFDDSTALQFWGSEKYERGIPLRDEHPLFSEAELAEFEARAAELNQLGQGDQIGVLLAR